MENDNSRYINSRITALGVYQVLGGLIGLYYLVVILVTLHSIPPVFAVIVGLGFLFYGFSIFCGVMMFRDRVRGPRLSIINQLLQVMGFSVAGFGFDYVSGISAVFNIDLSPSLKTEFTSGISNWYMLLNGDGGLNRISFNIVAIFLVLFIVRLQRRIHVQALEEEAQFDDEPVEPAQ